MVFDAAQFADFGHSVVLQRWCDADGALLVPYLAWVSFAAALNWVVRQLNPEILG